MTQEPKFRPLGTTDQSPRWQGPEETRPRGYKPADDPKRDHDAAVEDLNDAERNNLADIGEKKMHKR
jgi:hypothetical protein